MYDIVIAMFDNEHYFTLCETDGILYDCIVCREKIQNLVLDSRLLEEKCKHYREENKVQKITTVLKTDIAEDSANFSMRYCKCYAVCHNDCRWSSKVCHICKTEADYNAVFCNGVIE